MDYLLWILSLSHFIWKSTNTVTKTLKILLILSHVAELLRWCSAFLLPVIMYMWEIYLKQRSVEGYGWSWFEWWVIKRDIVQLQCFCTGWWRFWWSLYLVWDGIWWICQKGARKEAGFLPYISQLVSDPWFSWPSFYSRKGNFLTSFVSDQCLPNPK